MKKSPLTMGGDFFMPVGNKGFMDYEEIFSLSYLAECCDILSYFAVFYGFVSSSLYVSIKKFNNL
ncbi:hypothetical protein [Dialister succinatiphilus]|uniref:hypothetical protein n=1 Tax=Dialister succinatiphilus TaxID=487173 RepID=UPI003F8134A4